MGRKKPTKPPMSPAPTPAISEPPTAKRPIRQRLRTNTVRVSTNKNMLERSPTDCTTYFSSYLRSALVIELKTIRVRTKTAPAKQRSVSVSVMANLRRRYLPLMIWTSMLLRFFSSTGIRSPFNRVIGVVRTR